MYDNESLHGTEMRTLCRIFFIYPRLTAPAERAVQEPTTFHNQISNGRICYQCQWAKFQMTAIFGNYDEECDVALLVEWMLYSNGCDVTDAVSSQLT